jgi:chromate transporter
VSARGDPRESLRDLALLFLKLGTIAFGGPAAHVAMMEDEIVRRRRWLTQEQFLDMLGATNLIPGPNSTEMAIHVGYRQAGLAGLAIAGTCFILPAAILVTGLACAYVRFGRLPAAAGILGGIKPVVIALIVQAIWRLGRQAVKTKTLAAVGIASAAAILLGVHELLVLFGATALTLVVGALATHRPGDRRLGWLPFCGIRSLRTLMTGAVATSAAAGSAALWPLFLLFLKIGSILFGSGYVLLAFLRADFVARLHWLTEGQLLDATAIGQVTPGPVFTTATFIGYLLLGPKGALVATIGIFLPSFVFVAASAPFLPILRRSAVVAAALDGLNVASLALMAVVTGQLGLAAVRDWLGAAIALVSAVLLLRFQVNTTWLVLGGAVVGVLATLLGR